VPQLHIWGWKLGVLDLGKGLGWGYKLGVGLWSWSGVWGLGSEFGQI